MSMDKIQNHEMTLWELHYKKAVEIEKRTYILLECGDWSFKWMANQVDSSEDIGIAFVLGKEHAFVNYNDMNKSVDELALDCAKQILGYSVGSARDIARKRDWYQVCVQRAGNEIKTLQESILRFEYHISTLDSQPEGSD